MSTGGVLQIKPETRYVCHVYNRSYARPHIGAFLGASREEALNGAYDAVIGYKGDFSDEQLADARDAWERGIAEFELDEDGFSLAFFSIVQTE